MLKQITPDNINQIKNQAFLDYAQIYNDINENFRQQILAYGLPITDQTYFDVYDKDIQKLEAQGLKISNDHKSLTKGWVSPSCITCRKGTGTATFLISTQCPRNCYFCFNPNQHNYEYFLSHQHNVVEELEAEYKRGVIFKDLALTGGEPLLHKEETAAFFRHAKRLYPKAYARLYTCGAYLDEDYLQILKSVGLDEIRFSIKTDDPLDAQKAILNKIHLSKDYIPNVMVEMPVFPDNLEQMQELLLDLDEIGVKGINILELCYPFNNTEEFAKRGYQIKSTMYRVLYNYWYAGGLPIAGSEENCLRLLQFALDKQLKMGVHYCSLENKYSGQIYQQNYPFRYTYKYCTLSEKDYFLKSAKVFGQDVILVEKLLQKEGIRNYRTDQNPNYLEFPVTALGKLKKKLPDLEVGISYYVVEKREGENVLRELRVDYTTPDMFNPKTDI
jgi:uncharacterized protein